MTIVLKKYFHIEGPDGELLLKPNGNLRRTQTELKAWQYAQEDGRSGKFRIFNAEWEVEVETVVVDPPPETGIVVVLNGESNITIDPDGGTYTELGARVTTDAGSPFAWQDLEITVVGEIAQSWDEAAGLDGLYEITYTATDDLGNTASEVRTLTINTQDEIMKTIAGTLTHADDVPDSFQNLITNVSGVGLGATATSNTFSPIGVDSFSEVPISVDVGTYSIDGGAHTSSPGIWMLDQTIELKHTASGSSSTQVPQTVTIGGISGTFTSTTVASAGSTVGWLNGLYPTTLIPQTYNCGDSNIFCVGPGKTYSNIQAAVTAATSPGDVVVVDAGTYAGFECVNSGTPANPILVTANGNAVTVNTDASVLSLRSDRIYVNNCDHLIIEGFTVSGATQYGIGTHDASATSPADGTTVRYCTVSGTASTGIYMSNVVNGKIIGNTVSGATGSHGIYLTNGGSDNGDVVGNTTFGNSVNGIHFNGDASDPTSDGLHTGLRVTDNKIYGNTANGIDGDGVYTSTFENNLIYENGNHGIRIFQIDASAGAGNLQFVNNTIVDNGGAGIKLTADIGGHTFFNNIIMSNGAESIYVEDTGVTSDYNCFTTGSTFIPNNPSLFRGSNSINSTTAVEFVDAVNDDYSLTATALSIDYGQSAFNNINAPLNDIDGAVKTAPFDLGSNELDQPAANFYVDNAVSSSGNGLTPATAKKTINEGIALCSAGNILQIQDGTYPDVSGNTIGDNVLTANPGNSGSYIIVRAETDGGVEISAPLGVDFQPTGNVYYEFHGLKWKSAYSKGIGSQYIKFFRCAYEGGPDGDGLTNVGQTSASDFQLFEDCWMYGSGGRWNMIMFNATNIVLRRCVMRHDGGWGFGVVDKQEPELTCSVYPNDGNPNANILLQNCIVVDSDTYSPPAMIEWAPNFTNNTHGTGASNSFHRGCICLNSKGTAFGIEGSGTFGALQYTDCVSVDNEAGFVANLSGQQTLVDGYLVSNSDAGSANFFGGAITLKNGVMVDNTSYAFGSGGLSPSYNNCFNNGGGGSGGCGTNFQSYDPDLNGLKYPTRIESGGALLTDGEGGGQIGPTIMKKRGVSGTLYGDPGYDDVTSDDLWPFPNEDRIKTDMASVTPVTGQVFPGQRGFCTGNSLDGSPQTLTKYIWESLGNQIPGDIY